MAYPQLTDGMTTVTFSRGNLYPVDNPVQLDQKRLVSQGKKVRVAQLGPDEEYKVIAFRQLPYADYLAVRAFLLAKRSNQTFTLIDSTSTSYTVRWWPSDDRFSMPDMGNGLYNLDLPVRVES